MLRKKQRSFFQNNSCQNQDISCQRWGDVRYFAIIKPETKREKREMHSEKDSEILGQEGDTNGLKAGGIQK